MQHGRIAMRGNRQQLATRVVLMLTVLLASVWTASPAPAASHATDQLTASRPLPGIEPTILRDRLPVVRPLVERQGQGGRLPLALLVVLVAALAVAYRRYAGWSRPGLAPARPPVLSAPEGLERHPASSRPDPCLTPAMTGVG
jgi:hypothetical protein